MLGGREIHYPTEEIEWAPLPITLERKGPPAIDKLYHSVSITIIRIPDIASSLKLSFGRLEISRSRRLHNTLQHPHSLSDRRQDRVLLPMDFRYASEPHR